MAKTPFRRVLKCQDIDDKIKERLKKSMYDSLNPAELKRKILKLQDKLLKLNSLNKSSTSLNEYQIIFEAFADDKEEAKRVFNDNSLDINYMLRNFEFID